MVVVVKLVFHQPPGEQEQPVKVITEVKESLQEVLYRVAAEGVLALPAASLAILLALVANTATKLVVAATTGGLRYAALLSGPHLAMLAAAGAALAIAR